MKTVLGFDTSCYTTSAALVDENGQVIGSYRMLLPVPSGQHGLRQSEAVFMHVRQIPKIMEAVAVDLHAAKAELCAVAASHTPTEDENSYMPVFLAGTGHAKVLSELMKIPFYPFSHQQGHIAAGQIGGGDLGERFIALHISGGTTDLLLCDAGRVKRIGGSLDLHAGQLVDRVGVSMGCSFPAGPHLEKLAVKCSTPPRAVLPASMEQKDLWCHFSGAEAQCGRLLAQGTLSREEIALEVFDFLSRTVFRLLKAGCDREKTTRVLVVGGVASSELLRTMVQQRNRKSELDIVFGKPEYSADNAAGIACLGMRQYKRESNHF